MTTSAADKVREALARYDSGSGARSLDAARHELTALLAELDAARAALREFETWANGYERPQTGMGSGLHCEMWPSLTPSARRRMLEIARAALGGNDDK